MHGLIKAALGLSAFWALWDLIGGRFWRVLLWVWVLRSGPEVRVPSRFPHGVTGSPLWGLKY